MTREITLSAGQVWVPAKERYFPREITQPPNGKSVHYRTNRDGRLGYSLWAKTKDFRAWITRTGAVLQE